MSAVRGVVAAVAVALALVLQVSVFGPLAWEGVVPNLCLLVVVAGALTRGPQFAMVLGFGAGLLLDLAPPADHVAGRWALALLLVGYLVGRVRPESRPTATTVVATVAGASFVGTSVFALSGVLLSDPVVGVGETLSVLAVSLVWDVLLTPFVLPPLMALFRRLEPAHAL
ncbi:rod shape-determining protein MreD [Nocardioides sp. SOB44]|uniref:Rod shape-determining protein MreD n=1 Tax=Nocardioides cremeus TaxID=3058044 RepID=A0ABT8TPA7_9ACTN|nr:rod shape-determining protein MreD [Nocardioides cremeus]MDO3394818.1 rod shape-determining protein MreD [Nocardioides cremeus]